MKSKRLPDSERFRSNNPREVWLDKQDIMLRMCISSRTLQRWREQKILPCSRIGRNIYYREADVLAMLEKANLTRGK